VIFCEKKKTIGELFSATPEIFQKWIWAYFLFQFFFDVHIAFFNVIFVFFAF